MIRNLVPRHEHLAPLRTTATAFAALAALSLLAGRAGAQDGDFDPTFGNGAGVRAMAYDLGAPYEDSCGDLALDPAGTLLVGGTSTSTLGDQDWMLSRLAPGGASLESRQFFFDLGADNADQLGALAFDGAGRALVAGSANSSTRRELRICRLLAGSLGNDPNFNAGACVAFDLGSGTEMTARRVAPTPDGGILVAGSVLQPVLPNGDLNWFVLKLSSTGAIDVNFGFFGIRVLAWNIAGLEADRLLDMAVDRRSGAIFLVGEAPYSGGRSGRLAKLSPAGNLDLAFGVGGFQDLVLDVANVPLATSADAVALDPVTGTIWVALEGDYLLGNRLAQTGVGPTGDLSQAIQYDWSPGDRSSHIRRLVRQSDGKLLAIGESDNGTTANVTRLAPFAPTFANIDSSYGLSGTMRFEANLFSWGVARSLCAATLDAGRLAVSEDSDRGDIDQLVVRLTAALIFTDGFESTDTLEWSATAL